MRFKHCNSKGFTLVELIVVMALFSFVIGVSAMSFSSLVKHSSQQSRIAEGQFEGLVGLELLRVDLEHAGYGLPWEFSKGITYHEAAASPVAGVTTFADLSDETGNVPRAIASTSSTQEVSGVAAIGGGPDYLVIKSVLASTDAAARRWSYVNYSSTFGILRQWGTNDDLKTSDKVIVIKSTFNPDKSDGEGRQLFVSKSTTAFYTSPGPTANLLPFDFSPDSNADVFITYSLSDSFSTLRMPFNRTDYYVRRPTSVPMPTTCAPNTGILYKGVVSLGPTGDITELPLLDCVADMQVVFDLDTGITTDLSAIVPVGESKPKYIRDHLKMVRVYILAQEGTFDKDFTYPATTILVGPGVATGRLFELATIIGPTYKNYRWKVYKLSVQPKNLQL